MKRSHTLLDQVFDSRPLFVRSSLGWKPQQRMLDQGVKSRS